MTREQREEYASLIREVNKIDKEAGKYLKKRASLLTTFFPRCALSSCFAWCMTPQGQDYWLAIDGQLPSDFR